MKENENVCEEYWWQNPAALIRFSGAGAGAATSTCKSATINALSRATLIVIIVGAICLLNGLGRALSGTIAIITAILLSLPVLIPFLRETGDVVVSDAEEGFESGAAAPTPEVVIGRATSAPWTQPTANNPFMNVLLAEYGDNPGRFPAMSASDAKETLNDFFRTQWFSDTTDVFGRNQNQRQFITMPSTSIPNDRESYQNWLYKIPGKTCKEGGRQACLPATDGGPLAWLNFDS